jgi:hypothetical protein
MRLMSIDSSPRVVTARGPLAAERVLLEEIESLRPRTPEGLASPVRVIVPSASLREHVLRRIVETCGHSVVGVVVQTMFGLAMEINDRLPVPQAKLSESTFQLLIRRLATGEESLREALQGFEDGYGSVVSVVRDLIDAGFGPEHEDPLLDAVDDLELERMSADLLRRVRAVIRVAARTVEGSRVLDAGRASTAIQGATRAVEDDPDGAVSCRAILIHGWADATGVAADFLGALLRTGKARILLDHPPDPLDPVRLDVGVVFTTRLEDRLSEHGRAVERNPEHPLSRLEVFRAADRDSEAREIARRIRELIDQGQRPESLAVVARDLKPYSHHLARQLDRFGVPFTATGLEVPGAGERVRLAASLAAILREREEVPAETWIEAMSAPPRDTTPADLALGMRVLGVARLRDVVDISLAEIPDEGLTLPVVDGICEVDGENRRTRRRIPRVALLEIVTRASGCCRALREWPIEAPADRHHEFARRLLRSLVGEDELLDEHLTTALAAMPTDLARGWYVTRSEWVLLSTAALNEAALAPLGGRGGGVAVLSAMEARARTFDHLFVVGCNRSLFPRTVVGDPLLPDWVRLRLGAVLRDIPIKARGWDEERYLFAQLAASAKVVTLSYSDSDGGQRAVASPFVDPFIPLDGDEDPPDVRSPWDPADVDSGVRPAYEHAIRAALNRQSIRHVALAEAIGEGLERFGGAQIVDAAELARARSRVVAEADRWMAGKDTGPFSGHVARGAADSMRSGRLPVTLLEAVARCPWKALVERVLGVAPVPDLMMNVPEVSSLEVGQVVHNVLSKIVADHGGAVEVALGDCLVATPVTVKWPPDRELEQTVTTEAEKIGRAEGMAVFGAGPLLARIALPLLQLTKDLEFNRPEGRPAVHGAEIRGSITHAATGRSVTFRADRVDAGPVLTDYKTGKPKPIEEISQGLQLQASVYARAGGPRAIGRYVYLGGNDKYSLEERELVVQSEDRELAEAADRALDVVLAAWDHGAFFPRVDKAGSGGIKPSCRFCAIKQACRRDDSSFRRQLVEWMGTKNQNNDFDLENRSGAAAALWSLGRKK